MQADYQYNTNTISQTSKCCVSSMMNAANLDFAKRLAAQPVGELDVSPQDSVAV